MTGQRDNMGRSAWGETGSNPGDPAEKRSSFSFPSPCPTVTVLRAPAECQAFAQGIAFNLPNNPKW